MRNIPIYRLWLVLVAAIIVAAVLVYISYQRKLDRVEQRINDIERTQPKNN